MSKSTELRKAKIQQELKALDAHGYPKPQFIPLGDNFKVSELVYCPPELDEEEDIRPDFTLRNEDNLIFPSMHSFQPKLSIKELQLQLEKQLQQYEQKADPKLAEFIQDNLHRLSTQTEDYKSVQPLHERIMRTLIGKPFFENINHVTLKK